MADNSTILRVNDLNISFKTSNGTVHAVRGVDFTLRRGEIVAIVGESGCGKSVTVKSIMGIQSSNESIDKGQILFTYKGDDGTETTVDIAKLSRKKMQSTIKGKRIAMVFQDPMTSLDPTMSIEKQLVEGMRYHMHLSKEQAHQRAVELLEQVGITDAEKRLKLVKIPLPEKRFNEYPHQLSGGMRQRVVIAIALSCNPELLICDEPTTALDVTIQARILDLIIKLQKERNISVIFITHDLGVVAKVADYVNVMYAGKIVEKGTVDDIFYDPRHPYTWGLLSSMPDMAVQEDRLYTIPGSPPNLINQVTGDPFAVRNPQALNIDFRMEPPMFKLNDHHEVASWLLAEGAPEVKMPEVLVKRIEKAKKEAQVCGGV